MFNLWYKLKQTSYACFVHRCVFTSLQKLYLGLDDKRLVSSNSNLLLHDTEAVEPADEHPGTV